MGKSYVIDHCIAALQEEKRQRDYQIYVTECLYVIAKNSAITAAYASRGEENATSINVTYRELIQENKVEEPEKTADEIIAEIMADLGEKPESE